MKKIPYVILFSCGLFLTLAGSSFAAEPKPSWQATWEKTLAAAKKEGKLNFYVGRYGTEPLLNEFRKEFPEIQLVSVNGTGNSLGTRITGEMRAGRVVAAQPGIDRVSLVDHRLIRQEQDVDCDQFVVRRRGGLRLCR